MTPLKVHIKHSGKTYDVQLDPGLPPAVFKDAVYRVTGVPSDRMKVMVKGGVLKVDPIFLTPLFVWPRLTLYLGRLRVEENRSERGLLAFLIFSLNT